ncbi:MAG: triphosphoribosyl-dephospho-CoA synthase, partial [Treponema sp.]|nr:triphosphoribosyl-dephospho-CoA synthase [Treponema sp.]
LLRLIARAEDTNLIFRSDLETLSSIREEAENAAEQIEATQSLEPLVELDRRFIARNLSPGGSADLLALALFFHFLEETAERDFPLEVFPPSHS